MYDKCEIARESDYITTAYEHPRQTEFIYNKHLCAYYLGVLFTFINL